MDFGFGSLPLPAAGSSGVYVELFVTQELPTDVIVQITEVLVDISLDCIMIVDNDLLADELPEGCECTGVVVVPPAWMGPPMQTVAELREWAERVRSSLRPFRPDTDTDPDDDRGDDPEFG